METDSDGDSWRVRPALPALKLTGAALMLLAGLMLGADDPVRLGLAMLSAAALLGWGLRDLLVPVRLAADSGGVTVVAGLAGRRRLPWARIERITAEARAHRGLRTQLLEIDAGDSLHLFSANDLGAPPDEVAARLRETRARAIGG
ncbi:PH domain-containing protein [Micromonospora pattaloongensis]|uniref:PH domain-containing protein n=1 Tax=Micromonospora pattaloongensis TaxID=405436 RepID=A0A1H3HMI9_9ACTN|nr:PH domain-containing protein [Micromonospora pattaloongensis]